MRGLFRAILEQAGHAVSEACSGTEGIQLFRDAPVEVVITDIFMPEGDGFDVIRQLRHERRAVKILAISGGMGEEGMLTAASLVGADLVLPKPVGVKDLVVAVASLLDEAGHTSNSL